MPLAKLTKRFIDTLKAGNRRVTYYDTELKGFGIRVSPSGAKSWCVEYRPGEGGRGTAKRRMVLGCSGTLTPDQARLAARRILASVALGDDPAALRTRARAMPTFLKFADRYLSEEATAKLKPNSLVNYRIYLLKHAAPAIGNLKLDKVRPADIAKMHRVIGQTKPVTANRTVECVSSVYRYAATSGLVDRSFNPTAHIQAFREPRRERFLAQRNWLGSVRRYVRLRRPAFLGRSTKASPRQSMLLRAIDGT